MRGSEAVVEKKLESQSAPVERTKNGSPQREPDNSLGKFLAAAREKRGLSREDAIKQTSIPAHYLKMLENDDYTMISDQLYLLPFLRRYSTFLAVDPEETAMRFVREVQRADSSPPAGRIDTPLEPRRRKPRSWSGIVIVAILIAVIAAAYLAESRHRESTENPPATASGTTTGSAAKPEPASGQSSNSSATGVISRVPPQNSATAPAGQKTVP